MLFNVLKASLNAPNKDFCSELFLHDWIAIEDFLLRRASPPPSTPPFLPCCSQDFFRPYFLRTGNSDTYISPFRNLQKEANPGFVNLLPLRLPLVAYLDIYT